MRAIRRVLHRERRGAGTRVPIRVPAHFDLDGILIPGPACDIGLGGVFFETSVPLAPGVRGELAQPGGRTVAVRVSWARRADGETPAGLGLEFESNDRK